jgi:4-hydroxy-2-oxoheptanedioate aldolase
VLDRCTDAGIPCAIAVGADGARAAALIDRGFRLVIAGNDATMLGTAARTVVADLASAQEERIRA